MHAVTSKKLKGIMLSLKSYRKRVLDDYLYEKIQEYIHFGYGECGAGID